MWEKSEIAPTKTESSLRQAALSLLQPERRKELSIQLLFPYLAWNGLGSRDLDGY
jgi:hypothetical protein